MTENVDNKKDLHNPEEIRRLVELFYGRVAEDDLLGPVFVEQAAVDWEEHFETITAFWCRLELGIIGFRGSPTQKHAALSREEPFRAEQFGRWIDLFYDTIDGHWSGPHAEAIKSKAMAIAVAQSRAVPTAEPYFGNFEDKISLRDRSPA